MNKIACLLLLLVYTAAYATNNPIDSIRQRIAAASTDSVRGREWCQLCWHYRQIGQPDSAWWAVKQGLALTRHANDPLGEARCQIGVGALHKDRGDYDLASQAYYRSLALARQHQLKTIEAAAYNNLGNLHEEQGRLDSAESAYRYSLRLYNELQDLKNTGICLGNLAVVFENRGQYAKAVDYYLKALRINRSQRDVISEAINLLNIGDIFSRQKKYTKAVNYIKKSLAIFTRISFENGRVICLSNLGSIYLNMREFEQAQAYVNQSIELSRALGDRLGEAADLVNLGNIAMEMRQFAQARAYYSRSLALRRELGDIAGQSTALGGLASVEIMTGNFAQARRLAQESLELGRQASNLEAQRIAAQHLCSADSALGLWREAFETLWLYKTLSDSANNAERAQEIGRLEAQYEYEQEAEALRLRHAQERRIARLQTRWIVGSASGALLLLGVIAFTLFRGRARERRSNATLRALNEEILAQKAEIEAINAELEATLEEVRRQQHLLAEQHEKITDSIRYAWRIQQAILPSPAQQATLPPHFIFYQPRDIVSGDFYWFARTNQRIYIAVADCTGHGVPGAFMSVLGVNLLQQIVTEEQLSDPANILFELNVRLTTALKQDQGSETLDGMDLALVALDECASNEGCEVIFAAANRPLWHLTNGQIVEYRGEKYPCGGRNSLGRCFASQRFRLRRGERLFMFSDGLVDQFGIDPLSQRRAKYGTNRLRELLLQTAHVPIASQGQCIEAAFHAWRSPLKQLDDVLMIGLEV